jgi:addiction module HigA family antidote
MLTTKRKPASVGEILIEEFMEPKGLTQGALAKAMGVQRKHVNELCNNRRAVTAPTALILARVFGNSADFWLNVQRRSDLWEAMHSPRELERIKNAPVDSYRLRKPGQATAPRRTAPAHCRAQSGPRSLATTAPARHDTPP